MPAALAAAAVLWLYSLVAGTPYQEAKALVHARAAGDAVSVRALLERAPTVAEARRILGRRAVAYAFPGRARVAKLRLAGGIATIAFLVGAGGSSLLALANGPVGPSGYSPELAELRDRAAGGLDPGHRAAASCSTKHGRDYLAWELRGNRICVDRRGRTTPPRGAGIRVCGRGGRRRRGGAGGAPPQPPTRSARGPVR